MRRKLMIAGAAFCAALFLFSGIMLFREYHDQKQSAEAFEQVATLVVEDSAPEEPENAEAAEPEMTAFEKYAEVFAQNDDLIGWISIPGTRIDYPVMQTKDDPDFYLKHAFDKSYSNYGVPYAAENCDADISDNMVVYGHHMNNGSMFSDLCKYADEDFYREHKTIYFDTLGGYGEYEVIAAFKTVAYSESGFKLHYNINHPNSAIEYFNCSNYRGNRGTCNETHYVRADSLEQVVLLELNRMVSYLQENEEEFAELLARKTSQDYEREKRFRQQKLAELNARYSEVDMLFERTYEDNVSGKLSDERFMKLSQRYDEEQQSLKKEIAELESICDKEDSRVYSKNQFLKAVRKFMQMKTLTPTMLHELVERIDVYHIQGTGKNRTQRLVIHYKFVGVLDLPHSPVLPGNIVLNSRQGVEIEYLVGKAG